MIMKTQKQYLTAHFYGTPEGTFHFQYLPEKKLNKKNWKRNQNDNILFKQFIIFPFQY